MFCIAPISLASLVNFSSQCVTGPARFVAGIQCPRVIFDNQWSPNWILIQIYGVLRTGLRIHILIFLFANVRNASAMHANFWNEARNADLRVFGVHGTPPVRLPHVPGPPNGRTTYIREFYFLQRSPLPDTVRSCIPMRTYATHVRRAETKESGPSVRNGDSRGGKQRSERSGASPFSCAIHGTTRPLLRNAVTYTVTLNGLVLYHPWRVFHTPFRPFAVFSPDPLRTSGSSISPVRLLSCSPFVSHTSPTPDLPSSSFCSPPLRRCATFAFLRWSLWYTRYRKNLMGNTSLVVRLNLATNFGVGLREGIREMNECALLLRDATGAPNVEPKDGFCVILKTNRMAERTATVTIEADREGKMVVAKEAGR